MATHPVPQHNFTVLVAEVTDDGYDALVADIWVGVVLTLMVLSCVCCVCSCLLYHKFQQWKRSVLAARSAAREATEGPYGAGDLESLPSYTIVSGLPSYEEALEQLRLARERRESLKSLGGTSASAPAPTPTTGSASNLPMGPPISPTTSPPTGPPMGPPTGPPTANPMGPVTVASLVSVPAVAVPPVTRTQPMLKLSVAEFFQTYKTYPPPM